MGTPIQSGSSGAVEIHYSRAFDGKTPALCGVNEIPKPASDEWRYVTCRDCLGAGKRSKNPRAREAAAAQLARLGPRTQNGDP